jgi:hypothetical protein
MGGDFVRQSDAQGGADGVRRGHPVARARNGANASIFSLLNSLLLRKMPRRRAGAARDGDIRVRSQPWIFAGADGTTRCGKVAGAARTVRWFARVAPQEVAVGTGAQSDVVNGSLSAVASSQHWVSPRATAVC